MALLQEEEEEEGATAAQARATVVDKQQAAPVYYWPILSFEETPPQRIYHFHHQFKHSAAPANSNFLKGAKWSPDGSCFLVNSEDNFLRIFDLPSDSSWYSFALDCSSIVDDSFMSSMELCEGEPVYDFCWYPHMLASDPESCVFATTTRDHPVHLWDAVTGQLRCSYRAYDAMDEITAAYSVAFNPSGTKLFCGYNKTLRIFDTSCPGREFQQHSTVTSTKDGQTGVISCLAFNPCNMGILAAGSYDRTTAVYAENNMELLLVLHGQEGGVTQVQFSKDGNYLYTGGRKDPYIICWDLRNTTGIVYKLERLAMDTNQRIAFDIEPCGRHLGSGGQDGYVRVFDLQSGQLLTSFQASEDTSNGISFHPSLPLAVSSSGQRRYEIFDEETEGKNINALENCASVWRFSCSWENASSCIESQWEDSEVTAATHDNTTNWDKVL